MNLRVHITCLAITSLLASVAAAQSQVYLISGSTAVESLFPPSPPQDYHTATITTNPGLLVGTTITSTNSVITGGNTNGLAFGAMGHLRVKSYAYEPYGYDAFGHAILAGGTGSDSRAQFTEYLALTHPSLPVGTPVTITATFTISGSRTSPDAGNAGAFSTYAVGTVAIGDGVNGIASPTWASSPPYVGGRVLTIALNTQTGRTLFVTGQLQTSSSINQNAILVRSLEADYTGRVTLSSSVAGVNLVGTSGHNYTAACTGDLNNDTFVDDNDFIIFAAAYNILDCTDPSMPAGCPADLNSDGVVDDADFILFAAAYDALVCP